MTMAERVNHPAHYNAGGIECIDALEAATIGLEGIEAFCTANAIKYLWRWKRKNGEEDLQKAIWYINRIIDRAGEPPEERKGLFNMTENKHGFMPKQEITIGGIAFTIIQTAESWVKCIASECIGNGAFDTKNRNDFAASDIREFLNGEFLQKLIGAGAPEAMFEYFNVDLTADDGLKDYGGDCVRVGLITCDEYRLLRGNIPELPDTWWWTATPDSPKNSLVRYVNSDGTLGNNSAYYGYVGVRPLCVLKSEILKSYLDGDIYCRKFEPYRRGKTPLREYRRGAYLQNVVGVHRIGGRIQQRHAHKNDLEDQEGLRRFGGILSGERRYRYFGAFLFRRSDRKRTAGAAGAPEANS